MSDTEAFAAMDDLAEFAVEHAAALAELDRKPRCHWDGCPHGSECVHSVERSSGDAAAQTTSEAAA